jgi:DNA-binding GntR family transcriptional regulator
MSQCADLASDNAEDDHAERVRDAQADVETARDRGDIGGMVAANRKIRETLLNATHSPLFKRISEALFFRMSWNALVSRLARLDPDALVIDCSEMAKALAARDKDVLSAALHAHLSHVYEVCPSGELPCEITKRQRQE